MIQEQINKMRFETDAVKASDKEFPYCEHHVIIGGHPDKADLIKRHRLETRKANLQNMMLQIEYYINSVEDSLIRQLLIYRYVDGLKWRDIACKMGCGYTEEQLRKIMQRFFSKI